MASSNSTIKGLTVEIGANTTKFTTAMKNIDKDARDISKDLKTVNDNLKLDPSSAEKSADKLKLLQDAAQNASKKVDLIKEAIKKLNQQEADKSTDKYKNALADLERQLESAQREQDLANEKVRAFGTESESAGKHAINLGDIIKGNVIASAITTGLSKVGDLFANIAKKVFDAAKAVADFAKEYANDAVELAAAYQDAVGYSEQVYGDLAEESQKWVEDNSVRLRIYKGDLQGYVNSFGAIFNGFGYGKEQALDMSESLISLAADLRAATGKDIDAVIQSLTSGFTSSTKALQQFGVVTNEAAIKAKALEMGLVNIEVNDLEVEKATLKLTEANKKASEALSKYGEDSLEYQKASLAVTEAEQNFNDALGGTVLELDRTQRTSALLQIVLEDLSFLLGQSDKEADNYNSQLDTMHTIMQNLQEEIGEQLLPVYSAFLDEVNKFLQTDAGKAVMDALKDSVGKLADKVLEFIESEGFAEWVSNLEEEVPKVAEKIGEFTDKIIDLIPQVLDLTEKVVDFFDKNQKSKETKEAYASVQKELHEFAKSAGYDYNDLIKGIQSYAEETDTNLADIYNQWGIYKPEIMQYMNDMADGAEQAERDVDTALSGMGTDVQEAFNDVANTDTSGLETLRTTVRTWADGIASAVSDALDWMRRGGEANSYIDSNGNERHGGGTGGWIGNGTWRGSNANGGSVSAGYMYTVNDDAGHRPEIFVPSVNGYVLNGNQTDRIMNSVNNSRNFSGGIQIYVNSYGMNVAEVADELGAAFQQKIRMSGAML